MLWSSPTARWDFLVIDEAAWNRKVDVLEDQLWRNLVLLASQDFALQPDLEDESPEVDHVLWSANILEQALLDVVTPELVINLLKAALVQLLEVLEHVETGEDPFSQHEMALLPISRLWTTLLQR